MWQRIQTVFLAIAIIALIAALILPVWEARAGETVITLTPFYLLTDKQFLYFPYSLTAVLAVAGLTLAFLTLKRYDNRIVQMKLAMLNTFVLMGVMICIVVFAMQLGKQYPIARNGFGMYFVFAAVVCNWLALRFIRRDERLVKDSDRLR